ncbi:MAG: molybdopterin dinucleotide-binding protein [Methanomicrobiales archaeon]|nr:molybdopterin dinucleotide-binding protein [Methanomicrobiales archaeon]
MMLNTGRTIPQGNSVEYKPSPEYGAETSRAFLAPLDLMDLGIESGERIRVTHRGRSVVLTVSASDGIPPGTLFVPYGAHANHVVPAATHGTGMPDFKNIMVEVEPTRDPVRSVWELMEDLGGRRL